MVGVRGDHRLRHHLRHQLPAHHGPVPLSRLAADRSGAILIGRPSLLASALVKVTGEMSRIPTRDLRAAEHFNAFYFTPALSQGNSLSTLFSTHPPLQKRLDQLAKLEAEMNQPG